MQSNLRLEPLRDLSLPNAREDVPTTTDVRTEVETLEKIRRTNSAFSQMKDSEGSTAEDPFSRAGSAYRLVTKTKEGAEQKVQLW